MEKQNHNHSNGVIKKIHCLNFSDDTCRTYTQMKIPFTYRCEEALLWALLPFFLFNVHAHLVYGFYHT